MCLFRKLKDSKPPTKLEKTSSGSIKDFIAQRHGCSTYEKCTDPVKKAKVDADLKSYLGYR